jgi:hypothetical protein
MSINDTRYLERVEQHLLSKTQPNRGRSRSINVNLPQREQEGYQ